MDYFQYANFKFKQNNPIQQKKKKKKKTKNQEPSPSLPMCLKTTCLVEQCYRHCYGSAIFSKKFNFILTVSCNSETLTLEFPLAKGTFN